MSTVARDEASQNTAHDSTAATESPSRSQSKARSKRKQIGINPAHLAVKQLEEDFVWNADRGAWTPRRHQAAAEPKRPSQDESVA